MKSLGILVHGDNHFIVEGPLPDYDAARLLVWNWEVAQLGAAPPVAKAHQWRIITQAFRENLTWAVVLAPGVTTLSPAVDQLLSELSARGVTIHRGAGPWLPKSGEEWPGQSYP